MKDYKKILEGVVNIINTTEKSDIGFDNICAYIGENCPELKESEDEKIKEELMQYLWDLYHQAFAPQTPSFDTCNKWLGWLEKQCQTFTKKDVDDAYLKGVCDTKHELENQGEQKPAWSDKDKEQLDRTLYMMEQLDMTESWDDVYNWLKSLKERYTWEPSDEQIKVCKEVYADILSAKGFDLGTINSELNRLEERIKETKITKL